MTTVPKRRRCIESIREELVERLKEAYARERVSWHRSLGGPAEFKDTIAWEKSWHRMADFMLKHRIDNYYRFMHVQFMSHGNLGKAPTPRECYGKKALERWKAAINPALVKREIRLAFEHQIDVMKHAVIDQRMSIHKRENREISKLVLLDVENGLTALFRYCAAMKTQPQHTEIAELYYDSALFQYLLSPDEYEELWKDFLPEHFKREAATLRLSWL
jgi:hypothetical protein